MYYTINEDILEQDFGNSIILYLPTENNFFLLEDTSYIIWKYLKEFNSKKEIVDKMLMEFDVSEKTLSGDIDKVIKYLKKVGAIILHEKK